MSERVMFIVPAELVKKIDENRGDLSQAEFINFLIDSRLSEEVKEQGTISKEEIESVKIAINKLLQGEESADQKYATKEEVQAFQQDTERRLLKEIAAEQKYATKEEVQAFQQDTKKLLKSFLDFFVGYGLELGKQSPSSELAKITNELQGLEDELASEDEGGEVKIKWK